jgi:DNA-binding NtrC family response regulator
LSRILLVEDDLNTRLGLSEILMEDGYEVEMAEDAASAFNKMETGVDLLLSDFRLPDISGIELHKRIKEAHPGVRTIIMTAYSTPELYQQAKTVGVLRWVTKPLNVEQLLSFIREALEDQEFNFKVKSFV